MLSERAETHHNVAREMPREKVRAWDQQCAVPPELFQKLAANDHKKERNVCDLLLMPMVGGFSNMQKNNIAARLGLPQ